MKTMKAMKAIMAPVMFVLAAMVLFSCAQPKSLVYKDLRSFRVHNVNTQAVTVVMELEFYNPNNYGLSLKNGDLTAMMNERSLGTALIDEQTQVPPHANFILPVTVQANLGTIFQNALDVLTRNEVSVRLDGTIRAGKGGIFVPIPVHYSGRQHINL